MALQRLGNRATWLHWSILLLILGVFFLPSIVFGQGTYSTLINSGLAGGEGGFSGYLNAIYVMAISAAALLAVVKIITAGVKYMLSDIVTSKETAKKDIRTAILGLIIIISAVLILNVINPNLTDFQLSFEKLANEAARGGGSPSAAAFTDWPADSCAPLSEPVQSRRAGGSSTLIMETTTINTSGCTDEEKESVREAYVKLCGESGGSSATARANNDIVACAFQAAVETFPITSFGDGFGPASTLDGSVEYFSVVGGLASYDAGKFCTEKVASNDVKACLDDIHDAFINDDDIISVGLGDTYCENNAAEVINSSGPIYTCQLPLKTYTFEQARNDTPNFTSDTNSMSASEARKYFENICKGKLGAQAKLAETRRTARVGLADNICVIPG